MKLKINNQTITFKQGGTLKAQHGSKFPSFEQFYNSIPFNTDTTNYNLRRAFELAPKWQLEAWKIDPEHNHLNSIYWNENGEGEFMKNPNHPTINLELKDYNSKPEFNSRYQLDTTKTPWKYIPKAQPGMVLPIVPSLLTDIEPKNKTTAEQWNNLGTGLNIQKLDIPTSKSMTEPDDWRGKWETLLRKLRLRLDSNNKIKAIGVFSSAYGKPTTIVKDGGSLA